MVFSLQAPEGYREPLLDNLFAKLDKAFGEWSDVLIDEVVEVLEGIDSPDKMHAFFTDLRLILGGDTLQPASDLDNGGWEPLTLEPASPFGVFVRQCLVAYEGLPFEGACRLFSELQLYYQQQQPADGMPLTPLTPLTPGFPDDAAPTPGKPASFCRPSAAVGTYLQREAAKVEKDVGRRPAAVLEDQIKDLLSLDPEQSRAHYLRYLNHLHHNNYPAAVDCLHRYFDHTSSIFTTGADSAQGAAGGAAGAAGGGGGGSALGGLVGRGQNALLNLGEAHRAAELQLPELAVFAKLALAQFSACHLVIPHPLGRPPREGGVEDQVLSLAIPDDGRRCRPRQTHRMHSITLNSR
eukprot:gene4129-5106_t